MKINCYLDKSVIESKIKNPKDLKRLNKTICCLCSYLDDSVKAVVINGRTSVFIEYKSKFKTSSIINYLKKDPRYTFLFDNKKNLKNEKEFYTIYIDWDYVQVFNLDLSKKLEEEVTRVAKTYLINDEKTNNECMKSFGFKRADLANKPKLNELKLNGVRVTEGPKWESVEDMLTRSSEKTLSNVIRRLDILDDKIMGLYNIEDLTTHLNDSFTRVLDKIMDLTTEIKDLKRNYHKCNSDANNKENCNCSKHPREAILNKINSIKENESTKQEKSKSDNDLIKFILRMFLDI